MTRWLDPPDTDASPLASLNLPPLLAQTLIRRGIRTPELARAFIHPEETPSTPFPNIESAVDLIHAAIQHKDRICVWGDFDVDGQTSTTLLVQTLRALGADVMYYIPIRGKESHGVHIESLTPIIDNGVKLIVTCDTGITAHKAIDYANSRGVHVIVTDHHDLGDTLPNAKAIINPKLLPSGHMLENLAGVGVAYKLAEALLIENHEPEIENLLDLVALGLIADVALLKGETRSLAQKGIEQLRITKRIGLNVMAELSGTSLETLTEETIGFTFAPRLNALGRLGDANPAVELLTTTDPARARVLAAQIEGLNAQRRLLTSQVTEAAEAQLREHPDLLTEPAIVLSHPNWPGGVVGIVANRLVDRYHKPTLLLTESEEGILRGSARSVEGLHITEAIAANKDLLLSFGGHPMAAGVSLQIENLAAFRKGLGRAIEKQFGEILFEEPTLQLDAWLELSEINLELANSLELLAPFGAGNPPLKLATRGVRLKSVSGIGKTKEHLRLTVEDDAGNKQSILWWGGAGETLPDSESTLDIAYSLRASTFRGQKQVTLQFEEFRIRQDQAVEIHRPKIEIVDLRRDPAHLLDPSWLIWAEGGDSILGESRFGLSPANELVIYTSPPSLVELRTALETVRPRKIFVIASAPEQEKADDFLGRLAGLCKFALNQRDGKTTLHELAAALATRESAVQLGLEWLAAGGQLTVKVEAKQIALSSEKQERNPYLQAELFIALKGLLNESTEFRRFLSTTSSLESLLRWQD